MTVIYLAVSNVLFDMNTPCIVIIVNLTSKTLIFNKDIYLGSIYKYINISYIIIDITKAFIVVAATSTAVFKLFTATQKVAMLSSRYQRTSLTSTPFENSIPTISIEFIFILKIEAILIAEYITMFNPNLESILYTNDFLKLTSFTFINDAIYTIIVNII